MLNVYLLNIFLLDNLDCLFLSIACCIYYIGAIQIGYFSVKGSVAYLCGVLFILALWNFYGLYDPEFLAKIGATYPKLCYLKKIHFIKPCLLYKNLALCFPLSIVLIQLYVFPVDFETQAKIILTLLLLLDITLFAINLSYFTGY